MIRFGLIFIVSNKSNIAIDVKTTKGLIYVRKYSEGTIPANLGAM